jgi:glyoxylase I family protein
MNLRFHHACIETADYAATIDFYVRILGFIVEQETPGFHGRAYNSWLRSGDVRLEIQTPKGDATASAEGTAPDVGATGLRHLCFVVGDLDASLRQLETGGWTRFAEKGGKRIYEVEGGRLLKVIAPEGTIIELREDEAGRAI